jgi:hypothetical protein
LYSEALLSTSTMIHFIMIVDNKEPCNLGCNRDPHRRNPIIIINLWSSVQVSWSSKQSSQIFPIATIHQYENKQKVKLHHLRFALTPFLIYWTIFMSEIVILITNARQINILNFSHPQNKGFWQSNDIQILLDGD